MELSPQGIPIIDISPVINGIDFTEVAAHLATAMEQFGCCYIKNHGVKSPLLQDLQEDIHEFFNLPQEYKLQFAEESKQRGYVPFEAINVNAFLGRPGFAEDPIERLVFGPMNNSENPKQPNNIWPDYPQSIRKNLEDIYFAFGELAEKLTPVLCKAANPQYVEQFSEICQSGPNIMKVNFYPGNLIPKDRQDNRLAEHTDASAFTILLNDGRGLELKTKDGRWLHADPVPGALFLPLGHRLQELLDEKWKAVVHKVVWPEGEMRDRISLVYFISLSRFVERGPY